MTMIMVSYRRADAQDMAGRISDYLIGKYGEKSVFFDVNSIPTGVNYRNRIENAILGSDVMVAVIGLHWLGKNPDGKLPRISDPGDPVRVEIETAMKHKKPILPAAESGRPRPVGRGPPAPACGERQEASARRHHVGVNPAARDRRFHDAVAIVARDQDRIAARRDAAVRD